MLTSGQIRETFAALYSGIHLWVDPAPLVPINDPTLLFTNSGMAQFKAYFTGSDTPKNANFADIQTCVRTVDLDNVGDERHLTSFTMLGAWSIGSAAGAYGKGWAIGRAHRFLTGNEGLRLPLGKLYVTVYDGNPALGIPRDDDAIREWQALGVPDGHIVRLGDDDNLWSSGPTGPCGPCTEVFFDTGIGREFVPGGPFDTSRFIEVLNVVSMQYDRRPDKSLRPLPFTSVDMGAGLERLAMVGGGYGSCYETDLLAPTMTRVRTMLSPASGPPNRGVPESHVRLVTDHLRTATLIAAEGVKPGPNGRGYVLRHLLRESICVAHLAQRGPDVDLANMIDGVVQDYSATHPRLVGQRDAIVQILGQEQQRWKTNMKRTGPFVAEAVREAKGHGVLAGDVIHILHATHGVPLRYLMGIATANGLLWDAAGYQKATEQHSRTSRVVE